MADRKTKFVISSAGITAEILSVIERQTGDLLVIPKRWMQLGDSRTEKFDDVQEVRFSVHVTPNQRGHTLKGHRRLADGSYLRSYAHVEPNSAGFVFPLYTVLSPDLRNERYRFKDDGNEVISIGEYDADEMTLIYAVLVSHRSFLFSAPLGLNFVRKEFSHFAVCIVWGFKYGTSTHRGEYTFVSTGLTLSRRDSPDEIRTAKKVVSPTKRQLETLFIDMFRYMIRKHMAWINREFPALRREFAVELATYGHSVALRGTIEGNVPHGLKPIFESHPAAVNDDPTVTKIFTGKSPCLHS